jgi:hypothetical protein
MEGFCFLHRKKRRRKSHGPAFVLNFNRVQSSPTAEFFGCFTLYFNAVFFIAEGSR